LKTVERIPIRTLGIEHVDLGYEGSEPVFADIHNEDIPQGVLWIRGGTGSGKTTFLRFLVGQLPPLRGRLLINGKNVFDLAFHEFLPYLLNIGFGFEMGGLLSNLTLEDNLRLPLDYHSIGDEGFRLHKVSEMLRLFGMTKYRGMRPAHIPGGVRKAACVARAFIMDPEMVVLDDPSEGLGPLATQGLLGLIRQQQERGILKYAIISSSNINFIGELPGATLLLVGQTMMMLGDKHDAMVI
jgi:phospholipid/cholesterol/gamma-HCH transport system ATP-binding protein